MAFLLDTSILVRLANSTDAGYSVAFNATTELHRRGELLHIAPQNAIEFRNVATRPTIQNGLGLSAKAADAQIAIFEASFSLLADTPDIYPAWKALVAAAGTIGKQVHDARLVAICQVYNITSLLTFNIAHFRPLTAIAHATAAIHPKDI